jgi:hypothetical protein
VTSVQAAPAAAARAAGTFRTTAGLNVVRYSPEHRKEWDAHVAQSRNGVFLFHRAYMEYHADRFRDHSLLVRDERGATAAILPANADDEGLVSHGGLTFGGLVVGPRTGAAATFSALQGVLEYMAGAGLGRLLYKAVPHMYHRSPAEDDLYAVFRCGGRLVRRDIGSAVRCGARLPVTKGRKSSLKVARRAGVVVAEDDAIEEFMELEAAQLIERHGVHPVHTGAEMRRLADAFPANIRLHTAREGGALVGGMIVYESDRVAHAQYIATTHRGREVCALDAIVDHLLSRVYAKKAWFDFGISSESAGTVLNEGLIANKESYGARGVVHDFYLLEAD